MSQRQPIAFVLSGGGSLGAIQVGMLRALYERGIVPDLVVGSSGGALNAAFIASRPQTVQTTDDLGRLWRGLRRAQVVLPPPCPLAIQPIDFGHSDELIERAYTDACEFLDGGGAARPPIRMRMHRHDTHARNKQEAGVARRGPRPSTSDRPQATARIAPTAPTTSMPDSVLDERGAPC